MSSVVEGELFAQLGAVLVASLWQGLVVGAAAGVALACVRSAAARYRVACLALLVLVAWPAVTFVQFAGRAAPAVGSVSPPGTLHDADADGLAQARPGEARTFGRDDAGVGELGALEAPGGAQALVAGRRLGVAGVMPWAAVLWLLGVVAGGARLALGLVLVARLRRAGRPVGPVVEARAAGLARRLGLRARVAVLESGRLAAPVVVGVLRPTLLLPLGLAGALPVAQFEAVLAHELAHVLRRDYLVNLLQRVAETLMFHHPVAWWLSGVVRTEREHLCDEAAVRAVGGDPLPLAGALAALAARRGAAPLVSVAATGRAPRGALLARVRRLLDVPAGGEGAAWQAAKPALLLVGLALFAPVLAQVGGVGARGDVGAAYLPFELRYGHQVSEDGAAGLFISLDLASYVPSEVGSMTVRVRDAAGEVLGVFPEVGFLAPAMRLPVDPGRAASMEVVTEAGAWAVPLALAPPPAGFGPVGELRVEDAAVAGGATLRWEEVPGAALYEVRLYRADGGGGQTYRVSEPWVALAGLSAGAYEVRIRVFSADPMLPRQVLATHVAVGSPTVVEVPGASLEGAAPGRLRGRLLSASGPVVGEKVTLWDLNRPPGSSGHQVYFPLDSATTDGNGIYAFEDLAPGVYRVDYQGEWPPGAEYVHPQNVVYATAVAAGRETQVHDLYVVPQLRLLSPAAPARTEPGEVTFEWEPVAGAEHYVVVLLDATRYNPGLLRAGWVLDSAGLAEPEWTVRLAPAHDYGIVIEARDADGNLLGFRSVGGTTRGRAP